MPAGKYYCDYCDKEFKDTLPARKRHLSGIQHHRNRSFYYDSLNKDPTQFPPSAQAIVKGLCNRFVKTGACPYGDSCKCIHPKQSMHMESLNAQGLPPPPPPGADNTAWQSSGMSLGNLPPSLRPPPEGGYPPLPFIDWG